MQILTSIPFSLDADRIMAQAHVEAGSDDARDCLGLIEVARRIGRPKAAYCEAFVTGREGDRVGIGGVWFESRTLARNLAAVERVFPMVTTCGREMDDGFPSAGDMVQEFWWDLIKSHLLQAAGRHLDEHLHRVFRLGKTAVMRPGSGDATVWPIAQQRELFALLGDVEGAVGVQLTDSFLMVPNKTTSGLLFPTATDFRSCEVCHREDCPSRQAPFNGDLWEEIAHD